MFDYCLHCINLLLTCVVQEFAGEDMSDLFLEERETAIRQAQDEKRKVQMAVPGILGPHEIPEEMQD
jgi:exportin-1